MNEMDKEILKIINAVPGGLAKLAFDDTLTILFATDKFYSLIENITDKSSVKAPVSLLRMVFSADIIHLTQQIAAQKNRKDKMMNIRFRTLQHNGSFKWVMITGYKTEETYQSGAKTVPVYNCIAMDITDHMVNYKKLEQTNDYHRIISELSRDLNFEYEIATDTISFSAVFRDVFGMDAIIPDFRKRLEKTKTIHPDELPAVKSIYNSMMSGRKLARFEIRLIPKDGKPTWYTCYASIIHDENKNPYKVVGKLAVMNTVVKEESVYEPVLDSITNVCTKESAVHLISTEVLKRDENDISALMVIEIRNYKSVNETRRITQNENIFTSISRVLKSNLRSSDIIGRLGVSEFIVYVKGLFSDKAIYDMAENICREIEALHAYEYTKSNITASIGIAIQKGPQDYQTMLANANAALVMAKKVTTSSFEVVS